MAKPSASFIDKVGKFGDVMSVGGIFTDMVGGYFQSKFKANRLKSQALQFEHQQTMAKINAKSIESQAQHIARQYDKQIFLKTLQQRQQTGKRKASLAARGGQAGYGSSRDVEVSQEVLNEIDKLTINANKVKAVGNMRQRGVDAKIQADMLGVSAGNMFASANAVSPFLNMSSTLLTGAGGVATRFAARHGYGA